MYAFHIQVWLYSDAKQPFFHDPVNISLPTFHVSLGKTQIQWVADNISCTLKG